MNLQKKFFKSLIAFMLVLSLTLNVFLFVAGADTENYALFSNTVKDINGNWSPNSGDYRTYNVKWEYYNCYAFALHREENSHFYSGETENSMYQPGYMSGDTPFGGTPSYVNVSQLAKLVKKDLTAMGYSNVTLTGSLPIIDSTQELICVRTGYNQRNSPPQMVYHFMRYDLETDAWYHKPGNSAILKYNLTPTNVGIWIDEYSHGGVESINNYVRYDSSIVFITYTKKQINVSTSALSEQNINPGKDVFCEVNFEYAGGFNLQLSSQYSFEYELYNDSFDIVSSGSGSSINTSFSVNEGRYYLRMNFENVLSSSNSVNVSFSHIGHSYTDHYINYTTAQHKSCCGCGEYTLNNHVVAQGALPDSNGYGICILCRGQVFMGNLNSIPGSNMPHTANGSYILQNGVIVLVDEDIEAYMDGTLVFYTGEVQ